MIEIAGSAFDEIHAHAREQAPRECCGMLVGTPAHVTRAMRARNLETGATRFLIDPHDHIAALKWARERQLDVVGFYHSHPRSPAFPSETDVAESGYSGVMHLIVGGAGEPWSETRVFELGPPAIKELEYVVVNDAPVEEG